MADESSIDSQPPSMGGQIDEVCDRFEAEWVAGRVPSLEHFLPEQRTGPLEYCVFRRQLLEELIKIDLDHRWRPGVTDSVKHHAASRSTSEPTSTNDADGFPMRPQLEDYVNRYPELHAIDALSVELITEEYRVRLRWRDRPALDEYVQRFPQYGRELLVALREIADIIDAANAVHIRVYVHGKLMHSAAVPSPVEIGRQQANEPGPYWTVRDSKGCRFVIAPISDTAVSRRHARLELVANGQLQIANLSGSRKIGFQDGTTLDAQEICQMALPLLINFAACAIRVQRK